VLKALQYAPVVYSLHKSSTREHFLAFNNANNGRVASALAATAATAGDGGGGECGDGGSSSSSSSNGSIFRSQAQGEEGEEAAAPAAPAVSCSSIKCEVLAEMKYELPHVYKHQKKKSKDIDVDFLRFYRV